MYQFIEVLKDPTFSQLDQNNVKSEEPDEWNKKYPVENLILTRPLI